MSLRELHKKLHLWLCLCIAFFLPFARLVPIFIVLLALNWLIQGDLKNKFRAIFKNRMALLFIAFYLLHIIGLIYTNNISFGLFDIQVKLYLLVFPLILASKPLESKNRQRIFLALVAGCIGTILFLLFRATYLYFAFGENDFFYEPLSSYLLHPSYLAMYITVAIAWLLINLVKPKKNETHISPILSILCIALFTLFIVMLSSKTGVLVLLLFYVWPCSSRTIHVKILFLEDNAMLKGGQRPTCGAPVFL